MRLKIWLKPLMWLNLKQGNRRDMRQINVTRQFFEASGPRGDFFEKTKTPFLDKVNGSMCTKFQACIVFHLVRWRDTHTWSDIYTSENRNILNRLPASRGFGLWFIYLSFSFLHVPI